jgi:hypothetical protein
MVMQDSFRIIWNSIENCLFNKKKEIFFKKFKTQIKTKNPSSIDEGF